MLAIYIILSVFIGILVFELTLREGYELLRSVLIALGCMIFWPIVIVVVTIILTIQMIKQRKQRKELNDIDNLVDDSSTEN